MSNRLFRGVSSDGSTLSDQQLESMENAYEGVVACRGMQIQGGYLLALTSLDEPVSVPGITWVELTTGYDVVPLGKGTVSALLPDEVTG